VTKRAWFFLLCLAPAAAQEIVDQNFNTWLVYNGSHALRPKWNLIPEVHLRRHELTTSWQQNLYRLSAERVLSRGFSVMGGYTYFQSFRWGDFPQPARTHENRLHQQVAWRRGPMQYRARWEERWISDRGETRYQNRLRLQVRRAIRLNETWGVTLANELWLNVPPNLSTVFDQNRAQISVGRRVLPHLRVETGYLYQPRMQRNGRVLESNHTLVLTFVSDAPLFRKRR
jgi:hypothetical protein